jgi:hypothetical protein
MTLVTQKASFDASRDDDPVSLLYEKISREVNRRIETRLIDERFESVMG